MMTGTIVPTQRPPIISRDSTGMIARLVAVMTSGREIEASITDQPRRLTTGMTAIPGSFHRRIRRRLSADIEADVAGSIAEAGLKHLRMGITTIGTSRIRHRIGTTRGPDRDSIVVDVAAVTEAVVVAAGFRSVVVGGEAAVGFAVDAAVAVGAAVEAAAAGSIQISTQTRNPLLVITTIGTMSPHLVGL